jgi:hypothetical protein
VAETLAWDILARDHMSDVMDRLARVSELLTKALDNVGDKGQAMGRKMEEAQHPAHELGDEIGRIGEKSVKSAVEMKLLSHEIEETENKLKTLAREFAKTGDSSVAAKFRQTRSELTLLRQMSEAGAEAGRTFGGGFLRSVGQLIMATAPISIPVLLVGTVAIAAEVGAGAAGGLLGGLGLAGIAAGIIAQLNDPGVKTATTRFGMWLKDEFTSATSSFAEPLILGLGYLKRDLSPVIDDLRHSFQYLSPYVTALMDGLGQMAQKIMPGLNRAIIASGPILEQIGRDLPMLGNAVNIFFDEMSKGSKGAAEGLHTLLWGISVIVAGTGFLLRGLSNMFDEVLRFSVGFSDVLMKIPGADKIPGLKDLNQHLHNLASQFDGAGLEASQAKVPIDALTTRLDAQKTALDQLMGSWDQWFGQSMAVDQANLTVRQGAIAFTQALEQNGRTFDQNTAAGQTNYGMLLQQIGNLKAARDAQVAAGVSQEQANTEYQKSYDALMRQASAAGLTKGQVEKLNAQFGQLLNTLESLNGKTYRYTVWADQVSTGQQVYHGYASGGRIAAASGLRMPDVVTVGENGPEQMYRDGNGWRIRPNNQMTAGAATTTDPVDIPLRFRDPSGEVIQTALLRLTRQRGYRTVAQLLPGLS